MTLFQIVAGRDNYCVVGNPIGHSKSPWIHQAFASQTGQAIAYTAVRVPLGGFADAVREFRVLGGKGLNVTIPFKHEAWRLSETRSVRAERAGAVNTLWFDASGRNCGDNTDGVGLFRDLHDNHGVRLDGRDVLLLGAGGAACGVVGELLAAVPRRLVIANRTPDKARELATRFSDLGNVEGVGLAGLAGRRFDVIINATSTSLQNEVPALPAGVLVPGGVCYDMMYGSGPTAFVRWGREQGAGLSCDGLGMLVEQAAESFFLWRGVRPDTRSVIAGLRVSGQQ